MCNSKIKTLLGVLDMPEEKQTRKIQELFAYSEPGLTRRDFPRLAFRLRDEARKDDIKSWNIAIVIVALHINDSLQLKEMYVSKAEWQWAQHIMLNQDEYPIHRIWIIAALIAKELARDNNGTDAEKT